MNNAANYSRMEIVENAISAYVNNVDVGMHNDAFVMEVFAQFANMGFSMNEIDEAIRSIDYENDN